MPTALQHVVLRKRVISRSCINLESVRLHEALLGAYPKKNPVSMRTQQDSLESRFFNCTPSNSDAGKGDRVSRLIAGNYFDKYRSRNPVHRLLMKRFIGSAREFVDIARPQSVVEVGCGPGDLAYHLFAKDSGAIRHEVKYIGIDVSENQIESAKQRYSNLQFKKSSAYELPFRTCSVDLVVACEVLEHLENPELAVAEVARVTRGYAILSVPWEPTWRVLNVLRGKYLPQLGNTPGHIQHFSRSGIVELVGKTLDVIEIRRPFPWTMLLTKRFT